MWNLAGSEMGPDPTPGDFKLGAIVAGGFNGLDWYQTGRIEFITDDTFSGTGNPTSLSLYTTGYNELDAVE